LVSWSVATAAGVTLPDAAGAVDEHLVEAALVRPVVGLVAEVPLAEDAGRVTGRLQHLGHGRRLERQPLALVDRVRNAVLELVPAGQQGRSRRGAGRADMEVGEAHALVVQAVEVRRPEDRVTVARQVAVTLVVGQKEDDVWPACFKGGGRPGPG